MAGRDEAREELARLAKEAVANVNVDGWTPENALVMGAMVAADALVLSHQDAVLRALGGEPVSLAKVAAGSAWLFPATIHIKKGS
ncbi:MAG TPA: hypothetical protein VHC63_13430 [Acidimicrobiales bacterium]|nr:hypothetical protein [Acidimicrobiales bacterium]